MINEFKVGDRVKLTELGIDAYVRGNRWESNPGRVLTVVCASQGYASVELDNYGKCGMLNDYIEHCRKPIVVILK